jgi:hypothetical protein
MYPDSTALEQTLDLMQHHPQVSRQEIFDLFLVATMMANGVTRIYTYNQQHFTRFTGIGAHAIISPSVTVRFHTEPYPDHPIRFLYVSNPHDSH